MFESPINPYLIWEIFYMTFINSPKLFQKESFSLYPKSKTPRPQLADMKPRRRALRAFVGIDFLSAISTKKREALV